MPLGQSDALCDHRNQWVSYCSELDEDGMQCQAVLDIVRIVEQRDRYEEALRFYADEDSEPEVGGVDAGKTALIALGLIADD